MDTTDWKLLNALAEVGSMARAAELVNLSQPAVVYRVNRMEEEMETTLFLRSKKGIQLSSAGQRLLSYSNKMLFQNEQIKHYVKSPAGELCGELQIGSSSGGISGFLSPVIKTFSAKYPNARFFIKSGLNDEIFASLQNESIMIAVIRGDYDWREGSILIAREELVVIASEPITDRLLVEKPIIFYRQGTRIVPRIYKWYQGRFGKLPSFGLSTDHGPLSCIELVSQGLGWAVVPSIHIKNDSKLYSEPIRATDGSPFLHPTRLLFYDYLRQFDDYAIFIQFVKDFYHVEEESP